MYYYEINSHEYNKLLAHVYRSLRKDDEKIEIYKKLIKGLAFYENKVINIRIEKIVKEILEPVYSVSYYKSYGSYRLYIDNKEAKYYKFRFQITIGVDNEKIKKTRFKLKYLQDSLKKLEEKHKTDKENEFKVLDIVSEYNSALRYFKIAENRLRDIPEWYSFSRFN